MHVGPCGAWCSPAIGRPRIAPASARVTSVHGFSGATPVPRCSFLARWRPRTVRFFALIGSRRDAFCAPVPVAAAAWPAVDGLPAAGAGVALCSSEAD